MSIENMNSALARMQAMADLAKGQEPQKVDNAPNGAGVDFGAVLKEAIREVSDAQHTAQAKSQAFQMGEPNMSLEEVMISLQKANIAFQGMIAVRNKLVEAYKEVSNLQV